eukprot:TRINITY_DN928_c1_g1_i1.p1 TRINITY_DN928_c1_g1~~TRINITY_DN928_c1_g1_i1.p1  ORF type:complete len:498 (+),score=177.99 TRINITY_DN928_c1_g1_i1:73-1494(+)
MFVRRVAKSVVKNAPKASSALSQGAKTRVNPITKVSSSSRSSFSSSASVAQVTRRLTTQTSIVSPAAAVSTSIQTSTSFASPILQSSSSPLTNKNIFVRGYATGDEHIIKTPSMGESVTEATVMDFDFAEGDEVSVDTVIMNLESDKQEIEVSAPVNGKITKILVEADENVEVGQPLFHMEEGDAPAEKPASEEPKKEESAASSSSSSSSASKSSSPPPAAAKSTPTPPKPKASNDVAANPGGERRVKMSKLRQTVAKRLKDSQDTAAMLTTFQECDMSTIMAVRNKYKDQFLAEHGVKLGFMSAFVKASAHALTRSPSVNAVIDGKEIVYRDYVDISVAVATPNGLVVPVLRNCEDKSFANIEANIVELGMRARDGKLGMDEMQGGTFTISNGGVYGSVMGTPIINPPQSAILGMHGIEKRAVVVNDEIVIRPMMYLALTYDHRLIDGKDAVTFLRDIKLAVEDPMRLLLEL